MKRGKMNAKRICIIGSNLAGYTAALEIRNLLEKKHEIVVISPNDQFVRTPCLVWLPFKKISESEIKFDIRPIFKKNNIRFIHQEGVAFLPEKNTVKLQTQSLSYDYLLIATGAAPNATIANLTSHPTIHCINSLD
ncbi:MAG: sulfide:quinone oxidoreductase, partial [Candidatus Marinamargulisbacteria bacterium]